jgi:hypothetical protein
VKRAALLALCAVLGWMIGGWLFAAEPKGKTRVDSLGDLQTEAREACAAKGHTLRALLVAYDATAQPVAARALCGEPKRSKA